TQAPATTIAPAPAPTGQVIHVRAGANGNGSANSPLGSIKDAINRVNAGGTVLVHAGTYPGFTVTKSGQAGAFITIAAAPGERALLDPSQHSGIVIDNAHHVEVRGFEIKGHNNPSGTGIRMINNSHSVRIVGNNVYNFPGSGIELNFAAGAHILNNRIHGNSRRSPYQTSGLSIFKAKGSNGPGWDNVISGNIIYDNINVVRSNVGKITDGNCIIIDYNKEFNYQGSFLISNNICTNNGGRGIHVFHSSNVLAINNTLYKNLTHPEIQDGELTALESQNVIFRNNLVWSIEGKRDIHAWRAGDTIAQNNYIVGDKRDGVGGNNPQIANPQLRNPNVNPAANDFRPNAGSPLIGKGLAQDAPSRDIRGTSRPANPTIGALEP
ncbi:MAG: hypothetical protein HKN91_09705, partial [Acidimicrobiia bacterium]|nr:hypothetical protein [Acidimicrobiia bacterium]